MNVNENNNINDEQQFGELIKDIKFVMFTTLEQHRSFITSRPMTILEKEFDGELWFFGSRSSDLAKQIEEYPLVNLTFTNTKDFSFMSAQGFSEIVNDQAKKEELWKPSYKAWFSGVDDPDLCLIKVVVKSVDYWKSPDSQLVRLVGFAKAILSGEKHNATLGRHEHLQLRN